MAMERQSRHVLIKAHDPVQTPPSNSLPRHSILFHPSSSTPVKSHLRNGSGISNNSSIRQHRHQNSGSSSIRSSDPRSSIGSMSGPGRSQPTKARGRSRTMQPPPITRAEYTQLPPTLQRKYFSTFERLKIAQQDSSSSPPSSLEQRPLTSHATTRSTTAHGHSGNKKPRTAREDQAKIEANVDFYLRLPDKIRRQHFSSEEQAQIAAFLDLVLDKPTSARPSTKSVITQRNAGAGCPARSVASSTTTSRKRAASCSPAISALEIDTADWPIPNTVVEQSTFKLSPVPVGRLRRPAIRPRTASLSRLPDMVRTTPYSTAPSSPITTCHNAPRPTGPSNVRKSNESSIKITETQGAVFYQDPTARMKLRNYLASPQKFDEAVEFGFPATTPTSPVPEAIPPRPSRSTSTNDAQHFMISDSDSFLDVMVEEAPELTFDNDNCSTAPSSPATPSDVEMMQTHGSGSFTTRSLFSGLDTNTLPALDLLSFDISPMTQVKAEDAFESMMNREMTLRMTLTRPDLRAPEDLLYGWQKASEGHSTIYTDKPSDPLALSDLPVSDDLNGSAGPFSTRDHRGPGALRRFFSGFGKNKR